MLPAQMFLSSIVACLALIVFASWHAPLSSDSRLSPVLLAKIAKALGILLPLYLGLRFLDLFDSPALPLLLHSQPCNYFLGIELSLFLIPGLLLLRKHQACSARMLYTSALLVIAGFAVNRLNLSITSREVIVGVLYVPRWIDLLIASGVIALCVALFGLAAKHLAVFLQPVVTNANNAAQPSFCDVT